MTLIIDLSNEPMYTIKAVSQKIGVRPVTIRAWERRYEILSPFRLENRYRLYSDRDIASLQWLKNRSDNGVAISIAAGELKKMAKNGIWPEATQVPSPTVSEKATLSNQEYSALIYDALVHHDENLAGELFDEIHVHCDLVTMFDEILTPALQKIGEAWFTGLINISTEHFASVFLRGRLLALFQTYSSRRGAPYLITACAPDEQHEIGVLMLSVLLRANQYQIEFLGQDIPLEDLVDYASIEDPEMIILSATMADSAESLRKMAKLLQNISSKPIFAFGGGAFVRRPELIGSIDGEYLGNTFKDSLEKILVTLPIDLNRAKK